nr:hypothetical protein [Pedobacter sp. ASV2]
MKWPEGHFHFLNSTGALRALSDCKLRKASLFRCKRFNENRIVRLTLMKAVAPVGLSFYISIDVLIPLNAMCSRTPKSGKNSSD